MPSFISPTKTQRATFSPIFSFDLCQWQNSTAAVLIPNSSNKHMGNDYPKEKTCHFTIILLRNIIYKVHVHGYAGIQQQKQLKLKIYLQWFFWAASRIATSSPLPRAPSIQKCDYLPQYIQCQHKAENYMLYLQSNYECSPRSFRADCDKIWEGGGLELLDLSSSHPTGLEWQWAQVLQRH